MPAFLKLPLILLLLSAAHVAAAEPTLFLIGDSTVCNQALIPAQPLRGWGQMLPLFLKDDIHLQNHASSGQSSRSFFITERWKPVLNQLKAGDFVIIQFGHNDPKTDEKRHTEPNGEYRDNLLRYIRETREHGGTPILATPPSRCIFEKDGTLRDTHGDYPKVMRQVAAEQKVPLLDLQALTTETFTKLGEARSRLFFANVEPDEYPALPKGHKDGTHFNAYGASRICDMAVSEMQKNAPELAAHLRTGVLEPAGK